MSETTATMSAFKTADVPRTPRNTQNRPRANTFSSQHRRSTGPPVMNPSRMASLNSATSTTSSTATSSTTSTTTAAPATDSTRQGSWTGGRVQAGRARANSMAPMMLKTKAEQNQMRRKNSVSGLQRQHPSLQRGLSAQNGLRETTADREYKDKLQREAKLIDKLGAEAGDAAKLYVGTSGLDSKAKGKVADILGAQDPGVVLRKKKKNGGKRSRLSMNFSKKKRASDVVEEYDDSYIAPEEIKMAALDVERRGRAGSLTNAVRGALSRETSPRSRSNSSSPRSPTSRSPRGLFARRNTSPRGLVAGDTGGGDEAEALLEKSQ